jgi:hydrogenase/urease accessory protein HupE
MTALFLGLLAGTVHVLSGPDHLAAMAPLSLRRRSWRTGFVWGVGHTSGVWVVALLAFWLVPFLPVGEMSEWSDRLAGGALVLLGLWTLARMWRPTADAPHSHGALRIASLFGVLHGLAGSSHYVGILPAFAFGGRMGAATYLFGFGVGTVSMMTACAWGLGRVVSEGRMPALRAVAGMAAVVVGTIWCIR